MRWWDELRFFARFATRLGAYANATKNGATHEAAVEMVNAKHPPTPNDLIYHDLVRARGVLIPWGSALAVLLSISSPAYLVWAAGREGDPISLISSIGYGMSQLGWSLLLFGLSIGRFLILDLHKRWHTVGAGLICLILGTVLLNLGLSI